MGMALRPVLTLTPLSAAITMALACGGPAFGQSEGEWALQDCVDAHTACVAECREAEDRSESGAGCLIACATEEVRCAAGHAASGLTPWVERKSDELKRFLDDFLRDLPKGEPPPRPPYDPDYDST